MNTFPARALVLYDSTGQSFGFLRLAPREPDSPKWDCLFDIAVQDPEQAARSEVRWLAKRHYKRFGEHRVKVDGETGAITVSQAAFSLVLHPAEEGFSTQLPSPPITALWDHE